MLLADVEGSTQLWESRPQEMTSAFGRLDRTLAELTATYSGVRPLEQGEGDSFVIAFTRATDALWCALELQRAPLAPIHLRIGLHTGEIQLRDDRNYMGATINKTARLRDLAHGGQTVLSGVTEEMVVDKLPPGAWLADLGKHTLRGVARAERVFQLCHADLCNEFPPLRRTNPVGLHGFPALLTKFVGRAEEIKDVQRLVAQNRLVALTGAGGAGKTRLALEFAAGMADRYDAGAWFIDLSPTHDPELVPAKVAQAMGLPEQPGRPLIELITEFIADRPMLIVLDNCEHLLDASAELVSDLLTNCAGLTVLATTREPLGVPGEVTWRVPSLSIADEATELFVDRASRARPDFVIDDETIGVVKDICRRLDGMPLAIELAAARVRSLSLAEIADGLHDRFRLLTGGARTLTPRQQTLRASVEWSHDLLTDPERIVFRRLAVFVGGFDLDAVHAIAATDDIQRYDMLDRLTLLVDKSLVVAEEDGVHTRYRLLETVRQYALEHLIRSGEFDVLRRRHLDYYMAVLAEFRTRVRPAPQHRRSHDQMHPLLQRVATETDNLRAALASSIELEADPGLLVDAAYSASWLVDLALGARLAEAAIRAGGAAEAKFIRAFTLSFLGRGEDAETLLRDARSGALVDGEDAKLAFMQATNRLFTLADSQGAKALIDEASRATPEDQRDCIDAFLTVYWAARGQPENAMEASRRLRFDELPDVVARATAWAMTAAEGDIGRTAEAVKTAESGYPIPIRGYFVISDVHVGALLLAGSVHEARGVAEMFHRRSHGENFHSSFAPISATIAGRAALAAGRTAAASSLLASAATTFAAMGETYGWTYRAQLPLTIALAMSESSEDAVAALEVLEQHRHPAWRYLDYEHALARAWVAAGHDAVDEAIATVLEAAEVAHANGQFAPEVLCLQTAAQFGDTSRAHRLHELETVVEGPRVGVAAEFAMALSVDDAARLAVASTTFEGIGDAIAALDASAYASLAYLHVGMKDEALNCAMRAEALADDCGASTPALRRLADTR